MDDQLAPVPLPTLSSHLGRVSKEEEVLSHRGVGTAPIFTLRLSVFFFLSIFPLSCET